MGIETDGKDSIEALLESGKLSENASFAEIEAMLNGEEPPAAAATDDGKAAEAGQTAGDGKAASETGKTEDTAGATQAAGEAAATDGKQNAEQSSARDQQQDEGTGPIAGKNGGTIPYGVLEGTRKNLTEARRKLEEVERDREQERQRRETAERERDDLKSKLEQRQAATAQETRDVQAAAAAAGVKGDVRTVDVAKLRDNFPAEIVDAIEALQANNAALVREVTELRQRDASRGQSDQERAQQSLQDDIDSVPALAEWQAEGKTKWIAACAMDDALREDPGWKGKSRVDRFQEIARQLSGASQQQQQQQQQTGSTPSGTKPAAAGTKAKADEALAAAAARAVPLSHSGLPAGSAPAQSETESLERLDVNQLADKFAGMTDEQITATLSRIG